MIGTPIGILAGTYMAEYGRHTRLTSVVRFINDILLSAPSIVVGLFIYEVMVAPMGHFSGLAGRRRAGRHRDSGGGAHHRGHAQPGAQPAARGGGVARHAAGLHHCADMLPGRTGRHDHRRSARHCAHLGRDCSAPVHRANNQFWSTDLNAPMASLPYVIFQFALSPYKDWQQLAWDRRLDHHLYGARAVDWRAGANREKISHDRCICSRPRCDRHPPRDRARRFA